MMFTGVAICARRLADGIGELCFDRRDESVNKFDRTTIAELRQVLAAARADTTLRGLLITSAKEAFVVGADIGEFGALFALPEQELLASNAASNRVFNELEELPFPAVVAIDGFALGGGLEVALAADYRVASERAQLGLPEVKLGLIPGLGGTVRLPRIAGLATAVEWITSGAPVTATAAAKAGVVDDVFQPSVLRAAALELLHRAIESPTTWQARRAAKAAPVAGTVAERAGILAAARERVAARAPKHQPATALAIALLGTAAPRGRDDALSLEAATFARVARTQAADSLVQTFISDQIVKKRAKAAAAGAPAIERIAVLGAGIMGGGIAYASALRGIGVLLKDIQQSQLDLGLAEARKLLQKQVTSGRLDVERADRILASISPRQDFSGFDAAGIVIEAIVERLDTKRAVLRELEGVVQPTAVIASNTSSLRIDDLAAALARPQNLVGMHFFNPVPLMPLVEVVRGSQSSDAAVAAVVKLALAMGKTPIVVKDGPGFLVNRIITPYMLAFGRLLADGVDFVQIDAAMEAFGWPMGPAYLNDVVGMDTGMHVAATICAGFPERMRRTWKDPLAVMVAQRRLGQKTGIGFYRYSLDASGKPQKRVAEGSHALLEQLREHGACELSAAEIQERMMLPLLLEAARCLEEGVAASASELDMALLLGLGFPPYLGGALKYIDWLGAERVVELCERYAALGPLYEPPQSLRRGARKFYSRA